MDGRPFAFKNCACWYLTDVKNLARQIRDNVRGEAFEDWDSDCERFETIADWALEKVRACEEVALEDYAYGAKGKVFHIAENTGLLKYKLWKAGIPTSVIPPTAVKKQACGKGNADKQMMVDAFRVETKVDLKAVMRPAAKLGSPVTDVVDSYFVCRSLYYTLIGEKPPVIVVDEPPASDQWSPTDDDGEG